MSKRTHSLIPALVIMLACAFPAGAQDQSGSARGTGEIRGRLTEAAGSRPVSTGTISLRRAGDTVAISAVKPQEDGSFRFASLQPGRYSIHVRVLGFAPLVRSEVVLTARAPSADLGTLALSAVATKLEGMNVTTEREDVVIAPDRTTYSTKNMTTASGGTAVDVLRNVPAVDVDGSNRVSLRGNENVVVQINGRASPLRGEQLSRFLAQMPASTIKSVEVATNPSAKNDPEGTGGIINIVLNQEAELGLSGGFSVGTGTTGLMNISGNIGRQSGPLTLFASANVTRDTRLITGVVDRDNLLTAVPAFVEVQQDGSERPKTAGLTLRSEYRLDKVNALAFDALFTVGRLSIGNESAFADLDDARAVIGRFDLVSGLKSRDGWQDYVLAYRRTGPPTAASLVTELRYSGNDSREEMQRFSVVHDPDASISSLGPREQDYGSRRFPTWTLQTDHTMPFSRSTKLESGFKATQRTTFTDLEATYFDSLSARFVADPARTSGFDFRERIGAAYGVLSQQIGKVQAQAGLRLEQASTQLALPTVQGNFGSSYGSAFPSAILSYNLTEMRQVKASYSRRVTRPSPYQLSPIEVRDDQRTTTRGNPDLQAEYTDAMELSLQESRGWGSVQLNPYLRQTAHAVRYVRTVDSIGVTSGTFANLSSQTTLGADVNLTLRRGPMTLIASGSALRYTSDASNLAGNFSARGTILNSRGNLSWKLSPKTDAQMAWIYRAPFVIEGGSRRTVAFTAFSLRHKLWGEQGGVTLRVVDPFDILSYDFYLLSDRVNELSQRQYGQRGLFLTISRSFGQQLKLRPRQSEAEAPPSRGPGG